MVMSYLDKAKHMVEDGFARPAASLHAAFTTGAVGCWLARSVVPLVPAAGLGALAFTASSLVYRKNVHPILALAISTIAGAAAAYGASLGLVSMGLRVGLLPISFYTASVVSIVSIFSAIYNIKFSIGVLSHSIEYNNGSLSIK